MQTTTEQFNFSGLLDNSRLQEQWFEHISLLEIIFGDFYKSELHKKFLKLLRESSIEI